MGIDIGPAPRKSPEAWREYWSRREAEREVDAFLAGRPYVSEPIMEQHDSTADQRALRWHQAAHQAAAVSQGNTLAYSVPLSKGDHADGESCSRP